MKALFFAVDVHNMKPLLSLSLSRDLNLISELVTTNMPASTSTLTCSLSNLRSSSNGNLLPLIEKNINHMKLDCTSCTQDIVSEFADKGLFTGIGCIKDFQYKIVVDESVTYSSRPAHRLPPALHNIVEAKLRQMLNDKNNY